MRLLHLIGLLPLLASCAVVSVATTAVGVAADVAVGTVKVAGKAVGAAADAVSGDAENKPAPAPRR